MGEKKSADAPGESQRNDFSDAGSNPAISTKNPGQPFGAGLDFLYCGIRTREGSGVKKMCQRHIFSRKREGGTAREAWGVPSEQYAAAPQTVAPFLCLYRAFTQKKIKDVFTQKRNTKFLIKKTYDNMT